jgi:hypothetical protein
LRAGVSSLFLKSERCPVEAPKTAPRFRRIPRVCSMGHRNGELV